MRRTWPRESPRSDSLCPEDTTWIPISIQVSIPLFASNIILKHKYLHIGGFAQFRLERKRLIRLILVQTWGHLKR